MLYFTIMKFTKNNGIAIGPILFVVAILAALSAAITAGSGSFNSSTVTQQDRLDAQSLLEVAENVGRGVDRVMGNGCRDNQISFYSDALSEPQNPNAPADGRCHVFLPQGGGINPPQRISGIDTNAATLQAFADYSGANKIQPGIAAFSGIFQVVGHGTSTPASSASELVMLVVPLRSGVCTAINQMLGLGASMGEGLTNYSGVLINRYDGSYGYFNAGSVFADQATNLAAQKQGCSVMNLPPTYHTFTRVLLAR